MKKHFMNALKFVGAVAVAVIVVYALRKIPVIGGYVDTAIKG